MTEARKFTAITRKRLSDALRPSKEELDGIDLPHNHKWKRGVLSFGVYIKSCECGRTEKIGRNEFDYLA